VLSELLGVELDCTLKQKGVVLRRTSKQRGNCDGPDHDTPTMRV
jgi:hypothetical protein